MSRPVPNPFQTITPNEFIVIENHYATSNNFTRKKLEGYVWGQLWIHKDAYASLCQIIECVQKMNLVLVVWDAYRPYRATKQMVDWAYNTGQSYLVEEGYIAKRSRHNGGVAIDIGLRSASQYLNLGTEWDDFSEESHTFHAQGEALQNRLLLQGIMRAHGWVGYEKEWWHFELPNASEYPLFDIPYSTQS